MTGQTSNWLDDASGVAGFWRGNEAVQGSGTGDNSDMAYQGNEWG